MMDSFWCIWQFLKDHDSSNWFVIIFSLLVWPTFLSIIAYWWTHHKRQSISHFLVTFKPYKIQIDGTTYDAVLLTFINQTGSITYLYHARLKEIRKHFPVPQAASRDMARGWRELVLALPPTQNSQQLNFEHYELDLQTDPKSGRAYASIAIAQQMEDAFYSYRTPLWRRLFSRPKYFLLEYDIVVGERKFSVATIY
jgi:hypothetical protein